MQMEGPTAKCRITTHGKRVCSINEKERGAWNVDF